MGSTRWEWAVLRLDWGTLVTLIGTGGPFPPAPYCLRIGPRTGGGVRRRQTRTNRAQSWLTSRQAIFGLILFSLREPGTSFPAQQRRHSQELAGGAVFLLCLGLQVDRL